ncbi:carbohydrate-binding module family 50 protein [Amniculicola lignicola CBS 123094]|uniref:Carbohydrate-binding module family 50 protein n=1 Tax=Amniculicola lignicola CBS 123094 TaxID=1392246 RepID=A0A6A5X2G9_9PLEO|nr:carbohydrate-binding module family 50 protein [Amniculicola lignicola CBS 123094]
MKFIIISSLFSIAAGYVVERQANCAAFVGPDCPATRISCCGFHDVKPGETCNSVAQDEGIGVSEFMGSNPTINSGCTNMIAGCKYCVRMCGIPQPCPELTPGCNESRKVQQGDTCWALSGIPQGDWNQMNRFLCLNDGRINNPSCNNLQIGCTYCTAIPPDLGNNNDPCPGGYMSNPVWSGQTCWDLIGGYGDWNKLNKFFDMNPNVNRPSCNNLEVDATYCIPN